jgi:hypothetical protein
MANYLLQKYQEVAKTLVPYNAEAQGQMALININPTLPCFLCGQPAALALIAPAPECFGKRDALADLSVVFRL